jgi:predicted nucleic acid-binding protein
MKCCLLKHPLLRAYCSFLRIFVLRAFPNYSVVSLSSKELQYAHKLKTEYGLSIADSECIAVAKVRKMLLLSDDKYLGKMAINEEVGYVFDLVTFLEACIVKGIIQKEELIMNFHSCSVKHILT